jgi:A/G-specific adenine glycosylase
MPPNRAASSRLQTEDKKLRSLVTSLLSWFFANARDLPWRRTREPYAVWVSEIMLQQTQVKTVIPYYERWMHELPDINALAKAPSEKIHKLWEGLGYYTRVRNMQKAALCIVEKHGGNFPKNFDDVLALPGIGRYTTGAICSIAFNQPTPILDGNVIRVLTRVFGIRENAREKETNARLWNLAEQLVSEAHSMADSHSGNGNCSALNQSLMELGALVCSPRQPKCNECLLTKICVARRDGLTDQLPNLGERIASTARRFVACVVEQGGSVLVRQRPAGVVNGHLWEFPNVEIALKASATETQRQLEAEIGCSLEVLMPITTVKHSITRYRITLEAFRGQLNGAKPHIRAGKWVSKNTLEQLPFTSAHRRVLFAVLEHNGEVLTTR